MVFEARRLLAREKDVEESLKILLAGDPRAIYLQSIPGVGLMTTAAILAIGDNLSRFPNAKSSFVCGFCWFSVRVHLVNVLLSGIEAHDRILPSKSGFTQLRLRIIE